MSKFTQKELDNMVGKYVRVNYSRESYKVEDIDDNIVYFEGTNFIALLDDVELATQNDLANELKSVVEDWFNKSFNNIDLAVAEAMAEAGVYNLSEHIDTSDADELEEEITELQEQLDEDGDEECMSAEKREEIEEKISDLEQEVEGIRDSYPMWGTLFELKDNWDRITEEAKTCGFGVIKETDYFKPMLFVEGAGYSFYAQHWIPLYMALFGETIADKYKGVNYEGM